MFPSILFSLFFLFFFFFCCFFFYFLVADISDYPFPSVSACTSLANSPIMTRRDSILKHSGSIKNTDRRVSIKQNQPVVVEYLSEKRPSQPQINVQQQTSNNGNASKSNARPASLILTKGERPSFKLIRTPSIDQEQQDETLANALEAAVNQAKINQSTNVQRTIAPTYNATAIDINNKNNNMTASKDENNDDDDESAPLVQISDSTTITSSSNHL